MSEDQKYDRPVPVPDEMTAGFWAAVGRHELSFQRCERYMPYYYIPYIDLQLARYVDSHPAHLPQGRTFDLVRHIWRLEPGHEREEDCLIQQCRAGSP